MEIRQLKYFVKVAEMLSFSKAAEALYIAQSTLSQQIRQLEEEMNTELFQRNSHNVSLTETGKELLPYAKQTINDAETCFNRIRDLQMLFTGTLNIGVTFTFSSILTETLITFMKRYPNIKLNIFYKPMAELMDILKRRDVDFVLAFKPTAKLEEIESHVLFDNRLAVIVHDCHPLAKKEKIKLEDLEEYEIALPAKGLQARNAFDQIQSKYLSKLKIRIELNEVNILLKLIRQSNLVTILSEATIYNEKGVKAIPIDLPDNEMEGCIHVLRNTYRKHSALEFIKLFSESNIVKERTQNWLQ